jgi:predicted transcriptional regulator
MNRSRQEIIRDILATMENASMPKTKVMYRASLSYTQLKYYEDYLQNNKLIEITKDADLWILTEKGKRYLKACRIADHILGIAAANAQHSTKDQIADILTGGVPVPELSGPRHDGNATLLPSMYNTIAEPSNLRMT